MSNGYCHQCGREVKVRPGFPHPPGGYVCGLYPNCSKDSPKPKRVFLREEGSP